MTEVQSFISYSVCLQWGQGDLFIVAMYGLRVMEQSPLSIASCETRETRKSPQRPCIDKCILS